ncbi:hypothetical protein [Pseudomonas oryzihabitans]|uniref:hypothetical protein n=1 Tax=Pseudomonas oryzihabitans TaxID=47885 RepID=UPI001122FEB7|nr:hypothetical protein [Pseudomonas psychrotolerans]
MLEEIEGKTKPLRVSYPSEPEEKEGWICPYCKTIADYDQLVCLGCHADIVHGSTNKEREEAAKFGLMIGGAFSFLLFMLFPGWLNSTFDWHVPVAFGFGFYALLLGVVVSVALAKLCLSFEVRRRASQPPRFFRNTLN